MGDESINGGSDGAPILPGDGERVVMGVFEGATLLYLPALHRYRVELGDLNEEWIAVWEPAFGMDVADVQMAEEALDRLLARCS
ncbi:hypothetical protein G6L37_05305 [Agrobacterium rubi]|nr:hypothetical protein [Agrobacterium rubi]NTF24774.1 hypothetical protein [Agrobacterium rubi]